MLRARRYTNDEAQINIPAWMGGDAHHWYSTYVWVDLPTFERDFMNHFDYVHPEQALYMIKDRVQKPLESITEYRNRFHRMFVKTERGEQVGRDLFIDGLRNRAIRGKLRKKLSPINHTLQQIMDAAEEMELKFAVSFLENEDYGREGDSSELVKARAELAALQNKFENMGFVAGSVTYVEQVTSRTAPCGATVNKQISVMASPTVTQPPPPPPTIESPARANESTAILELTKTLVSLIQESKKEQREHNARLEAMMRNMRPIAVRAPMQGGMAAAQVAARPVGTAANACFTCHQPRHLARDCPHRAMLPRVGVAPAAAAPIANGPGRVGAMMDDQGGSNGMMISSEEAAELIPLEQYVSLGYPGLGMIGTIRPELESRDVVEWRPSSSEMETGGPTFVTGEIDVLEVTRTLDHRIPLPIGHLLSISEQANERMMQHCKANRKRFALARAKDQKAKAPTLEEKADVVPDAIRVGLIQKDDHFLRIKPIPWKSAECDIEVWGVPYSAIIDSGAVVLAISLRVVKRAGRKNDLIMLTEKDQLVSTDEEKIKTPEAISAILAQKGNDGKEHVIEYASRTVSDERRNDSAPQGECYAVVWGIQHLHPYLYGQKFLLVTDHEPLLALKKLTDYTGMIGRWAVRLQEYEFDIAHRKTERHGNADGLTCLHRPGCRRLLTQELTVPIAQLADDLDVSIVSQVDPRLVPHVTSRTLSPYLQWSACVEGFPSRISPSRLDYLDPRDIVDPAFYRPSYEDELEEIIREELAEESSEEEEENPNKDEGEPAQQQEGEEDELLQTENEEEAEEEHSEQGSGDDNDEEHADEDLPARNCAGC
ncbi:hypothetical protein CBR_g37672 [Chara braunii]|uniref:CCHC-type domain-containing protein n=1 Tax=Chara braunii TaxID=69332 RepID=A0A388JZX0_CHABU|nr:hypothetical protein CBR_g37672 [Chara braunii]|eukprot:GBG63315.1 hypothetical protein CBR_g37672 [Chara braunii]